MRLVDLSYRRVPVLSHSRVRTAPPPPVETPQVGARWGKASQFVFSNASREEKASPPSLDIRWPEQRPYEYMRLMEDDLLVAASRGRIGDEPSYVEVSRMARMRFRYTEYPPKRNRSAMQPSVTTYYDLTFVLHPPEDEEVPQ